MPGVLCLCLCHVGGVSGIGYGSEKRCPVSYIEVKDRETIDGPDNLDDNPTLSTQASTSYKTFSANGRSGVRVRVQARETKITKKKRGQDDDRQG